MSASEKLKALDPKADVDYGPAPFAAYVLLNAFPYIVAVVEAAEAAYEGLADNDHIFYASQKALAQRLAALDEELS